MRNFLRKIKVYWKQFPIIRPRGIINFFDYANRKEFRINWYHSVRQTTSSIIKEEQQYIFPFEGTLVDNYSDGKVLRQLHSHRIKTVPQFNFFMLRNAYIFSNEGIVLTEDNYIIDQSTHYFGAKLEKSRFLKPFYLFTKKIKKYNANVAVLATCGSSNYYHWLIDALPRLMAYEKYRAVIDFYVIPNNYTNAHYETLKLANIPRNKIITLTEREKIQCDYVLFSSIPSAIGTASVFGIKYLRELVLGKSQISKENKFRKIYITRENASWRKVLNEKALIQKLEDLDFEIHNFDNNLSVVMQAKLFNEAAIITSPHGACLANLVFADNCYVYELVNPKYFGADCYFTLACQNAINYNVIVGKAEEDLNYSIDIDNFIKMLEKV